MIHPSLELTSLFRVNKERIWHAEPLTTVELAPGGIEGDRHFGATRIIPVYERMLGSGVFKGVEVANRKSLSFVSEEDMTTIAKELDLPVDDMAEKMELDIAQLMAQLFAANALFKTIGSSLNDVLDPGALIILDKDAPSRESAIIEVTEYNERCSKPFINILKALEKLDLKPDITAKVMYHQYRRVAKGRRGWVGSIYKPGPLAIGQFAWVHSAKKPPIRG